MYLSHFYMPISLFQALDRIILANHMGLNPSFPDERLVSVLDDIFSDL